MARDGGGRRVYPELHLSCLELIERLRWTGMSIAQMREFTTLLKQGSGTLRQRQKLLSAHRARVKETIGEWTLPLELIDRKIDFYGEWLTTGKRPILKPKGGAMNGVPNKQILQDIFSDLSKGNSKPFVERWRTTFAGPYRNQ